MSFLNKTGEKIVRKFTQYKNLTKIIHSKTSSRSTFKSTLFTILLVLVIYFLPVALVINLFIYHNLRLLLSIILLLMFTSLGFVYFKIYYKLLSIYEKDLEFVNIKTVSNVEGVLLATVLFMLGIIMISVVF